MQDKPALIERQALYGLLGALKDCGNVEWKEYITEYFDDWEPVCDDSMSLSRYYNTLRNFPSPAKREIVRGVILGWNVHHDTQTLYQCICTLCYLKICDATTYFFMQFMLNSIQIFGNVCENLSQIYIANKGNWYYTLRFLKPNESRYGGTYGLIDFELAKSNEKPCLVIALWYHLLNSWKGIDETTEWDEGMIDEFLYTELNMEEMLFEFVKRHQNWLETSFDMCYYEEQFKRSLILEFSSLEYVDANGLS